MKKILLIIFFLSIPAIGSSQNRLDSFEKMNVEYFSRRFPEIYLNFQANEKNYTYDKLEPLGIIVLNQFLLSLPKKKSNYYFENSEVKKLADEILILPKNKQSYYYYLKLLKEHFQKDILPNEKIYFILFFSDYFTSCVDSSDLVEVAKSDCYEIARQQADVIIKAECYVSIGNFLRKYKYIPESLDAYLYAFYIYEDKFYKWELGDLYLRVAGLYNNKIDEYFKKDAIFYYDRAANYFLLAGDTLNGMYSLVLKNGLNIDYGIYEDSSRQRYLTGLYNLGLYIYAPSHNKNFPEVDIDKKFFFLSQIGTYFLERGDVYSLKIAESYYNASLIVAINNGKKYNLDNVYDALFNLSYIYALLRDESSAYYIDVAINMAIHESNDELLRNLFLEKSKILLLNNSFDSSIYYAKKSIDSIDSRYATSIARDYQMKSYIALSWIFKKMGKSDSEFYYSKLYKENLAELIQEVDEAKNMRVSYDQVRTRELVENKDSIIKQIKFDILYYTNIANHLTDSVTIILQTLQQNKKINDSLQQANSTLFTNNDSITKQNKDLDGQILSKRKDLKSAYWVGGILLFAALLALIIVVIQRIIIKNRDEKLKNTRESLNTLVQSKLHNVRNNYVSFSQLIRVDQDRAKEYSDNSNYFFSYSLNKFNNNNWTFADEFNLLDAYFDAERMLAKNCKIEIIREVENIDIDRVLFIPEIFTTLFHNSMKYAFVEEREDYIFRVKIIRNKNVIDVQVSDNGRPKKLGKYTINSELKKGLSILQQRLIVEFLLSKKVKKIKSNFVIEGIENKGVHIKFNFPYAEKIKNSDS